MNAEQIVSALLDEGTLESPVYDEVRFELQRLRQQSATPDDLYKASRSSEILKKHNVWLGKNAYYSPSSNNVVIPVSHAWHMRNAYLPKLAHELVHREQYMRSHRRQPFGAQAQGRDKPYDYGKGEDLQHYFSQPIELMAYGRSAVEWFVREGYTREQILSFIRRPETAPHGGPDEWSFYLTRSPNKNYQLSEKTINRFKKYMAEYATKLKDTGS